MTASAFAAFVHQIDSHVESGQDGCSARANPRQIIRTAFDMSFAAYHARCSTGAALVQKSKRNLTVAACRKVQACDPEQPYQTTGSCKRTSGTTSVETAPRYCSFWFMNLVHQRLISVLTVCSFCADCAVQLSAALHAETGKFG